LVSWFIKKVKNQVLKFNKYAYNLKLKRFKKTLRFCGEDTFIQFPVRFEGPDHISIGSNVSVNAFVHIWGQGGVVIGNDCLIASHVAIISVTHNTSSKLYRNSIIEKPVTIGKNVWIGSHAVIMPGIVIGENAIVGAGAVVTKNVPPDTTVAGVPAKIINQRN